MSCPEESSIKGNNRRLMIKLAARQLISRRRFTALFVFCFAAGMLGMGLVHSARLALEGFIEQGAKALAGADLSISARREFSEREIKKMRQVASQMGISWQKQVSHSVRLFSMVAPPGQRGRLIRVMGIDELYPLYGELKFKQGTQAPLNEEQVWAQAELAILFDREIGDSLKVGKKLFQISGFVDHDPSQAQGFGTLAPIVYIPRSSLAATELVGPESLVTSVYNWKVSKEEKWREVSAALKKALPDPAIRIRNFEEVSSRQFRFYNNVFDYFGLVVVLALAVSLVGAVFLFRGLLAKEERSFLDLHQLGVSRGDIRFLGFFSLAALSLLSALVAWAGVGLITLAMRESLASNFNFLMEWRSFSLEVLGLLLVMAVLAVITCLPYVMGLLAKKRAWPQIWGYFISAALFYGLTLWQTQSWQKASLLVGSLIISAALILLWGEGVIALAKRRRGKLAGHLAHRFLAFHPFFKRSLILGFGPISLLIVLLPQVYFSFQSQLTISEKDDLPAFFIFDIQDFQKDDLQELVRQNGAKLQNISPMVRSRLMEVNGEPYQRDKQQQWDRQSERERRFRNRGVNLSSRSELGPGEKVIEGEWMPPLPGDLYSLSVEKDYADRLELTMGDTLTFDIQGVKLQARVTGLRKINWGTFRPNFFVLIDPQAIEQAPKTYVATLGQLTQGPNWQMQEAIVEKFPNISFVDVREVLSRLLNVTKKLTLAIGSLSLLCLLNALIVVFGISNFQTTFRLEDFRLLKILGLSRRQLAKLLRAEFLLIGAPAVILGALLALGLNAVVSRFFFDQVDIPIEWLSLLLVPLLLVGSALLISTLATRSLVRAAPYAFER